MLVAGSRARWAIRGSVVALLLVLCFLAGFSITLQSSDAGRSARAKVANELSGVYQDARYWVSQEESLEQRYRIEPAPDTSRLHTEAAQHLASDFQSLLRIDSSPANRSVVTRLLSLNSGYVRASRALFRAVDAHNLTLATYFDDALAEPVFTAMNGIVYRNAAGAARHSTALTTSDHASDTAKRNAIVTAFVLGVALLIGLGFVIAYFVRRLDRNLSAEVKRLGEVAITDPLTGLRNHRAFQEDLDRCLNCAEGAGSPVSLIMLDHNELKAVNDSLGHQAGDDRLKAFADALRSSERDTARSFRIGGDEFAVILEGTTAWDALMFTQRLNVSLALGPPLVQASVSAGVSERLDRADKDVLIREAGLALVAAKRAGQSAAIYTPEMEPDLPTPDTRDEHHTRTLANALALAVDAKDSYTRSHSQTVSQLSALIATELGFNPPHIAQMRVAGLLHDVGKIGIPDAILNKPGKLTDDEYEVMKTHATVGHAIVLAADMPTEAEWIRHHHSRLDGRGYPDHISGDAVPIESRIIFVADSFEAMTSDRPYRKAPGQQFAIAELKRHSGTQFDPRVVDALCRTLGEPDTPNEPATARARDMLPA
jgi:diguanylate cyclase (GGDEF)-like protein/putative nucleotidyltransferase with HDIG domain